MKHYSVAVIAGDGIGPEVMAEGLRTLQTLERAHSGLKFDIRAFDWDCDYYLKNGG